MSDPAISPPRPRLAFRVGIVGHRPDRIKADDPARLSCVIGEILACIKSAVEERHNKPGLFSGERPVLRAYSPLAEGADRVFASEAIKLGYELCGVLPFPKAEYRKDFEVGSKYRLEEDSEKTFDELCKDKCLFELDGTRADEGAAYGMAGRTVVNQSDILIGVWDGERRGKRGGTEETLDIARPTGVPIVWVHAHGTHQWSMHEERTFPKSNSKSNPDEIDHDQGRETLRSAVQGSIRVPEFNNKDKEIEDPVKGLNEFHAESKPRFPWGFLWNPFRDCVGGRKIKADKDAQESWPEHEELKPYYDWPNMLGVYYADLFRSAFIACFILAAFAVVFALVPVVQGGHNHGAVAFLAILEALCIGCILGIVWWGRKKGWHNRWLNYRTAAELIRHIRVVAPLGGIRPFPQMPAHQAVYGPPGSTWMAWYARTVERQQGLPCIEVNKDYLRKCLGHLEGLVKEQIEYHKDSEMIHEKIEHRLHLTGMCLLALTLVCCILHLVLHWNIGDIGRFGNLLTALCGIFPAFGASLLGIINQGEFRRVKNRSKSMHSQLGILATEIEKLKERIEVKPREQYSPIVSALCSDVARLLTQEALDWRVVFLDRPLSLPS